MGFLHEIKQAITLQHTQAAAGLAGSWLEHGIDATTARKHLAVYEKREKAAEYTLLLRACTASLWTAQRRKDCGLVKASSCPRCGYVSETQACGLGMPLQRPVG